MDHNNSLCGLAPADLSNPVSQHPPPCSHNSGYSSCRPSSFLPQSLCTFCSYHSMTFPSSAHGGSSSPRPNSASTVRFSLPSATPLPSLSKELLSTCCYVVVFTVIPSIFPVPLRGSWGTSECSNSKSPTPTQENPS